MGQVSTDLAIRNSAGAIKKIVLIAACEDIKVNGQELASAFGVFSFDTHTKMILKETAPRTVRFIRPGSVPLSPLEILEMAKDIQQPTAKFSFVRA